MKNKGLKLRFRMIIYILTCFAILIADLTIVLINKYILSYKNAAGKHYITLIGMAAVLLIFYLFVSNINKLSEKFVNKFVHITRVYLGRQIGLYISVSILFVFLFAGYYWAWFDINLFDEVWGFIRSAGSEISSLLNI